MATPEQDFVNNTFQGLKNNNGKLLPSEAPSLLLTSVLWICGMSRYVDEISLKQLLKYYVTRGEMMQIVNDALIEQVTYIDATTEQQEVIDQLREMKKHLTGTPSPNFLDGVTKPAPILAGGIILDQAYYMKDPGGVQSIQWDNLERIRRITLVLGAVDLSTAFGFSILGVDGVFVNKHKMDEFFKEISYQMQIPEMIATSSLNIVILACRLANNVIDLNLGRAQPYAR